PFGVDLLEDRALLLRAVGGGRRTELHRSGRVDAAEDREGGGNPLRPLALGANLDHHPAGAPAAAERRAQLLALLLGRLLQLPARVADEDSRILQVTQHLAAQRRLGAGVELAG